MSYTDRKIPITLRLPLTTRACHWRNLMDELNLDPYLPCFHVWGSTSTLPIDRGCKAHAPRDGGGYPDTAIYMFSLVRGEDQSRAQRDVNDQIHESLFV
jgi:hypothetical protein